MREKTQVCYDDQCRNGECIFVPRTELIQDPCPPGTVCLGGECVAPEYCITSLHGVRLHDILNVDFEAYCCGEEDGICPEDFNSPGWVGGYVICPPDHQDPDCGEMLCSEATWVWDTAAGEANCDTNPATNPYAKLPSGLPDPSTFCVADSNGDGKYDKQCDKSVNPSVVRDITNTL
jgi:hypothetical protein